MTFGLFCKTFRRDLERFERLYDSVEQHDRSRLPFFLSVPRSDLGLFRNRFGGSRLSYLTDSHIIPGWRRLEQDWTTQQIVKLHFWRRSPVDAWLVVDADFCFIRDFTVSDFTDDEGRVAQVASLLMHTWDHRAPQLAANLRGEGPAPVDPEEMRKGIPQGHEPPSRSAMRRSREDPRMPAPAVVAQYFGRQGPDLNFLPGPVWTRDSLRAFQEGHLAPRRLGFADLIRYAPWEAAWVGEWEISRGCPGRFIVDPYFLHFATDEAIRRARTLGVTRADVARRYLGITLAAGHQEIVTF